MKNLYLISCFVFLVQNLHAQQVQWASKVIAFSSKLQQENDSLAFSPQQALGKTNVPFFVNDNNCFWVPNKIDKKQSDIGKDEEEYLKLGFAKSAEINHILISMNRYIGLLKKVIVYDDKGLNFLVYSERSDSTKKNGQFLNIFSEKTLKNIISVELRFQKVSGVGIGVDAVGITLSTDKKVIKQQSFINLLPNFLFENIKENLGENINTKGQEIAPFISSDGKILYFSRANHPENIGNTEKQDIWYADFNTNNKTFEKAKNIGDPLNNKFHNSMFNAFENGQKILLNNIYMKNEYDKVTLKKGLSMSEKKDGKWQFPTKIEIDYFYNLSNYSEFFMTNDQKELLMTVERKDGSGAKDIHVSFLQKNEKYVYSVPLNLGKIINSAGNEVSPFLSKDKKMLFFSSDGHLGYGNTDIFVSFRLDDSWTNWSEPYNLGNAVNSGGWDAYFSITDDNEYGYFCSYDQTMTNFGESDIFRIRLSELQRKILLKAK